MWTVLSVFAALGSAPAAAREAVEASAPRNLAVTLYRDPNRGPDQDMNREWPQGFAMITETRRVTLPPGQSTVRFAGVAEGMVAVSAIITGLPGGTIEKNRNADLLSPAALVDGSLGNRVTVTRTNPATGKAVAETAVIRTRADGGLVLQTRGGFEAVRCSGLPEKLTFDRVPAGLSAQPVYTIDTRDARGGTYAVQLTYLAWGFDWQAHYVATLAEPGAGEDVRLHLMSWLTLLNDNGQSFPDAELLVVAGKLNVTSDYRALADPPTARALSLTCYPIGSTAAGSPVEDLYSSPPAPPPAAMSAVMAESIVVTGMARRDKASDAAMVAAEEALGDLKLYRVPERVTISAKGLKQVAFLQREGVRGRLLYKATCGPDDDQDEAQPAAMLLTTVNDKRHGLGVALPQGAITVFEPSSGGAEAGDLLVGQERLRDYADGQDVEVSLGASHQVFSHCQRVGETEVHRDKWTAMRSVLTNANPQPATVRLSLGAAGSWHVRGLSATRVKDGERIAEIVLPANGRREVRWDVRDAGG